MGDGNWRQGYIDIGRRDRRGVSRGALVLISFKLGLEIRAILLKVTFVTTEAAEAERFSAVLLFCSQRGTTTGGILGWGIAGTGGRG